MRRPAEPHWQYLLRVEVDPMDVGPLVDGLEDEPFGLARRIGRSEVERQIREGELVFEAFSLDRLDDFASDVEILSVYLSQYVTGREYEVRPTAGAPILSGWKVVGRLGETVRLELDVRWDAREQRIDDLDEDLGAVRDRWDELPRWAHDALRAKHPGLRRL